VGKVAEKAVCRSILTTHKWVYWQYGSVFWVPN